MRAGCSVTDGRNYGTRNLSLRLLWFGSCTKEVGCSLVIHPHNVYLLASFPGLPMHHHWSNQNLDSGKAWSWCVVITYPLFPTAERKTKSPPGLSKLGWTRNCLVVHRNSTCFCHNINFGNICGYAILFIVVWNAMTVLCCPGRRVVSTPTEW